MDGELGTLGDDLSPQMVRGFPMNDPIVQVALGSIHSLALTRRGAVYALGYNGDDELGTGTSAMDNETLALVQYLPSSDPVLSVAAGEYDSLALTQSGRVYAWGSSSDGELGYSGADGSSPAEVQGLPSDDPIMAIATGTLHTLALTRSGRVYPWGANDSGQLGISGSAQMMSEATPVYMPMPDAGPITTIAVGGSFGLALARSGVVYAWGDDSHGALGDQGDADSWFPQAVPHLSQVTAIAAAGTATPVATSGTSAPAITTSVVTATPTESVAMTATPLAGASATPRASALPTPASISLATPTARATLTATPGATPSPTRTSGP